MEKRSDKIKFTHNKKLLWIILFLIILFIVLIIFLVNNKKQASSIGGCQIDSDCVPSTCCHPEQCVIKEDVPDCGVLFCSQVCLGPLDCGAGSCACVNNKCDIRSN